MKWLTALFACLIRTVVAHAQDGMGVVQVSSHPTSVPSVIAPPVWAVPQQPRQLPAPVSTLEVNG
jgi:hypothetical protein